MPLADHYDAIAQCNKCGFCQVACPIFRATGHEEGVARGRLALLRALIEERLNWTRELEEPLFHCLRCGACTSNCFPGVATADLIAEARGEYLGRVGRSPAHRLLFHELLPHPGRLRAALKAAAVAKNTGLSKTVRALRMLRGLSGFARNLPDAEGMVARVPLRSFRERWPPGTYEGKGNLRLAYFVGCGVDLLCPEAGEATLGILRRLGRTVEVLRNCCCGVPAYTYGDLEATRRVVRQNLGLLDPGAYDSIVTDCASCAAFLKGYPTHLDSTSPEHSRAQALSAATRDLVELVAPSPAAGAPQLNRTPARVCDPTDAAGRDDGERIRVTYHDPCHAVRGQGIVDEPRAVLRSLAGVEYVELPEADWCCGGAGSYAVGHYELSMQVLDRKMENVAKTGVNTLATSCPACVIQLRHGVRRRGLRVRVCHLSQLLSSRLRHSVPVGCR